MMRPRKQVTFDIARDERGSLLLFGVGGPSATATGITGLTGGATGAFSMSRTLISGYGGSYYHTTSSNVDTIYDQSGSSRNLTDGGVSTQRPSVVTAGPNSITAARFDGTSNYLQTASFALSNFIANNNGLMVVSAIVNAVVANSATVYQNDLLLGDQGQFMGLLLRNNAPTCYAYNWDGAAESDSNTFSISTAYVFSWRHQSGNVYVGINGTEGAGSASGNTTDLTNLLSLCGRGGQYSQSDVFEVLTFNAVPANMAAIISNMKTYIGG